VVVPELGWPGCVETREPMAPWLETLEEPPVCWFEELRTTMARGGSFEELRWEALWPNRSRSTEPAKDGKFFPLFPFDDNY